MARGKARSRYLPAGTTLHGASGKSYRIEPADAWKGVRLTTPAWVIGAGGFGITYRVVAEPGGEVMALKEYFPEDFADRAPDGSVSARAGEAGDTGKLFAEGLRKFSNEAQYLQELQHPNICRVSDAFMANGTAYYASDLVEGRAVIDEQEGRINRRVTLHDYLVELEGAPDPLTLENVRPLVDQLLDAVQYVHTEGPALVLRVLGFETRTLLHRDIKPSNILVRPTPDKLDAGAAEVLSDPQTLLQLIDFGSARGMAIDEGDGNTKSVAFITDSYAPPELKDNRISEQGPQSDIFSLAATFWRILVGKQPAMTDLIAGARAVNLGAGRAPRAFLAGMDNALQMDPRARPQSVADWRVLLFRAEPRTAPAWAKRLMRPVNFPIAVGTVAVLAVGFLIVSQLGGPTDHVYREADAAYQSALLEVSAAERAITTAQSHVDEANAAADDGAAAAREAQDNLAAKEASERPVIIRNTRMDVRDRSGRYNYTAWCTPDPGGDVTQDYTGRTFRCSSNLGPTLERPGQSYSGPTSPWRVDVGSSVFEGHVVGQKPSIAGTLSAGGTYMNLRIETIEGAIISGLGEGLVRLEQGPHLVSGKAAIATDSGDLTAARVDGSIDSWPDGSSSFLGQWGPDTAIGTFKSGDAIVSVGRRAMTGSFWGRVELGDGRAFVGARLAGDGFWWGALLRNGVPYYLGQVRDGNPEGCGVRIGDDGRRRGVYMVNGLEDPDSFRSECSNVSAPGVPQ
jgi:serine/threonine protein kinase